MNTILIIGILIATTAEQSSVVAIGILMMLFAVMNMREGDYD